MKWTKEIMTPQSWARREEKIWAMIERSYLRADLALPPDEILISEVAEWLALLVEVPTEPGTYERNDEWKTITIREDGFCLEKLWEHNLRFRYKHLLGKRVGLDELCEDYRQWDDSTGGTHKFTNEEWKKRS